MPQPAGPRPKPPRNRKLETARRAVPSPSGAPGMCMSRRELAEAANAYVWEHTGGRQHTNMTEHDIGRYERGEVHWPKSWRLFGLRGVLGVSTDRELGFYSNRRTSVEPATNGQDRSQLADPPAASDAASVAEGPQLLAEWFRATESATEPTKEVISGDGGAELPEDLVPAPYQYDLLNGVGGESLRSASRVWSQVVPEAAVEQVWLQVRALAREYAVRSPMDSLLRARSVRELGLELLEVTRRPRQVERLYLGIGHACALMGIASFDLRAFEASLQQAAAAYAFAEMVGHSGLCSWARGLEAQTAFWRGQPAEAVRLASHAVEIAPAGTGQARMLCILARAFSHLPDAEQTRRSLADAQRVRDSLGPAGADELHDEMGGPFGWGPARQAACASNALLRIGDADAAAEQARLAISLHDADGTGTLVDSRASADIAAAELVRDGLDAAVEALDPVWRVPPDLRRYGLLGRLEDIAAVLTQPRYRRSPIATTAREQISVFADGAPRGLPAGIG